MSQRGIRRESAAYFPPQHRSSRSQRSDASQQVEEEFFEGELLLWGRDHSQQKEVVSCFYAVLFEWRILFLQTTRGKRSTLVVVFCPLCSKHSTRLDDDCNCGCCLATARSQYADRSVLCERCWAKLSDAGYIVVKLLDAGHVTSGTAAVAAVIYISRTRSIISSTRPPARANPSACLSAARLACLGALDDLEEKPASHCGPAFEHQPG